MIVWGGQYRHHLTPAADTAPLHRVRHPRQHLSDPNRDSYTDCNGNTYGYSHTDRDLTRPGLNRRRGRARLRYLDLRGPKLKYNYENKQQN